MLTARIALRLFLMLLVCIHLTSAPAKADTIVDGVPLPSDVSPVSDSTSPLVGIWVGTWGGTWKTILLVESVKPSGEANVVYALGENPKIGFKPAWFRLSGKISDTALSIDDQGFKIEYSMSQSGRLQGVYNSGTGYAVLEKYSFSELREPNTVVRWTHGESVILNTELIENDRSVKLEAVVYAPKGDGPFPLAIVNHGSTGSGNNTELAKETWSNEWLADFLNARGWIAAFPQRRGRGKSDGLYDEGFSEDRSHGYTCETIKSLAGVDRALLDMRSAVKALRQRPDVTDDPILTLGNSRGGALSIAYAGKYPDDTHGAVNFVGGWMGTGCNTADKINQTLFASGGNFKAPTLWLYGKDDVYYSIEHSRKNFGSFRSSGGKGTFFDFTVQGKNNGHWVMYIPGLWNDPLEAYLNKLIADDG